MFFSKWIIHEVLAVVLFLGSSLNCSEDSSPVRSSDLNNRETMYVEGRHIYSASGERALLRGVNEMFVWSSDPGGSWVIEEIAKTGANSLRIVTSTDYNPPVLDSAIQNSIQNGMIPIPECHSATGEWDKLQTCVDYWLRPDITEIINKHQKWVILNIANEAGDGNVTREEFEKGYKEAIGQIRNAGIRVPLVIDGTSWGQEYRMLLDTWDEFNDHDPENAIIVSAHTYWNGTEEERKDVYRYIFDKVLNEEIPFILGEGPTPSAWDCTESPYQWALEKLEEHQIGWLAWSWGLVKNGDCNDPVRYDMTHDGVYGNWKTDFGRLVAVDHPASIKNSSRRPCSIPNAGVNCVKPD